MKAFLIAGALSKISLNVIAMIVGVLSNSDPGKQAIFKRLKNAVPFFSHLLAAVISHKSQIQNEEVQEIFRPFGRVLVQDSTLLKIYAKLRNDFPGTSNQHGCKNAMLKIQSVCNLLTSKKLFFSFSGYNRNDQTASPDILEIAKSGDLVLRDLGYFSIKCFARMNKLGIFYLSRLFNRVILLDHQTGNQINLLKELQINGCLDREILLGIEEKLPSRLVAIPVPEAIANERRRKAKENRDKRAKPSETFLKLLGWEIFVTNVDQSVLNANSVKEIYFLRWRIEIIFKAWKSHLNIAITPNGSKDQVLVTVLSKLFYITIFQTTFDEINCYMNNRHDRFVSILKMADFVEISLTMMFQDALDAMSEEMFESLFLKTCCYERRKNRTNFFERIKALG